MGKVGRPMLVGDKGKTKLFDLIAQSGKPMYIVAAECGFSPTVLSLYSTGRKPIHPFHLAELCRVFKLNPYDIVGLAE